MTLAEPAHVDQRNVVTVCEVKMSLRRFAAIREPRNLVNSRIGEPRIKVVAERGAAKTGVDSRATSFQHR